MDFNTVYVRCPSCNGLHESYEIISYTVSASGTHYTDGKSSADVGLPSVLARCAFCGHMFPRLDARIANGEQQRIDDAVTEGNEIGEEVRSVYTAMHEFSVEEYFEALKSMKTRDELELHLRIELVHKINDHFRKVDWWFCDRKTLFKAFVLRKFSWVFRQNVEADTFSKLQTASGFLRIRDNNLERMIELLERFNQDGMLDHIHVDCLRSLGRWKEAHEKLRRKAGSPANRSRRMEKLQKYLIRKKDRAVVGYIRI
jgi:hypothetical protein